ncbi:YceI family protein, partial [Mycobacterium tuberculosis]
MAHKTRREGRAGRSSEYSRGVSDAVWT